jgi:16S rRNA (guanine1516-N2)-methyltransferase
MIDKKAIEKVVINFALPTLREKASMLARTLNYPLMQNNDHYNFILMLTERGLELQTTTEKNIKPIYIDFLSGKLQHRRLHGGGKNQLLSKAVGLHKEKNINVLDVTAGLGQDAFVLACLGAKVTMLERSPIIAALLQDALDRAQSASWFADIYLKLKQVDAKEYLKNLANNNYPDVIYCDPMFPERTKTALVKKEMRIVRQLVGEDDDAREMLNLALIKAKKRVVVKRPKSAACIIDREPDLIIKGKSSRYDIYLR